MKKNAVGHMVAAKEPVGTRLQRWHLVPKLLCLILALLIWLVVVNVENCNPPTAEDDNAESAALWLNE